MAYPRKNTPVGHREKGRQCDNSLLTPLRLSPETYEKMVQVCETESVTMTFLTRSLIEYALEKYD